MAITEEKINKWREAAEKLAAFKEKELALRKEICEEILAGKAEGTVKRELFGAVLVATAKINKRIDTEVLDQIWNDLPEEQKECVIYRPSLVQKHYKKIGDDALLKKAVIVTPGTPTLKVK